MTGSTKKEKTYGPDSEAADAPAAAPGGALSEFVTENSEKPEWRLIFRVTSEPRIKE
jgi:hypothetical protein